MLTNHLNLSEKLTEDYKVWLFEQFNLDCSAICFKPNADGEMHEDAKIALVAYKAWSAKQAELNFKKLQTLILEERLTRYEKADCFWDENNESGETFRTIGELAASVESEDRRYAVVTVGRSVQLDNAYMVLDHKTKEFTLCDSEEHAVKAHSSRVLMDTFKPDISLKSMLPISLAQMGRLKKTKKQTKRK